MLAATQKLSFLVLRHCGRRDDEGVAEELQVQNLPRGEQQRGCLLRTLAGMFVKVYGVKRVSSLELGRTAPGWLGRQQELLIISL